MSRKLSGKVVVITGASSGIGRAIALRLAKKKAHLVLAARREQALHDVARECEQLGARAVVVPCDVSRNLDVEQLAARAVAHFGRVDAWVNNAGVYVMGSVEETPLEVFHQTMDVNYFGTVYGTRTAVAHLKRTGGGVIVNVSSQAGSTGVAYASAYAASKHAVRGFTSSVRQELLGTGVELCTVMPAGIDTPLFEHTANYTGRAVRPPEPVYPPEKVARTVVRLLRHPAPEVYVGSSARLLGAFRHATPRGFDRVMRRTVEHGAFQRTERRGPTTGNLYEPMARGQAVHGGWHGVGKQWVRRLALLGGITWAGLRLRRAALGA